MIPLNPMPIAPKESGQYGLALNEQLGLSGVQSLPNNLNGDSIDFSFNLNNGFMFRSEQDIKAQVDSGSTILVGVSANNFGMVGVLSTAAPGSLGANCLATTGPTGTQGIVNCRLQSISCLLGLNAAGVIALAGKTVRFALQEWNNQATVSAPVAFQDILSPQLNTLVIFTQLLNDRPFLPYPNTYVLDIRTLDGTVFPAATTVQRHVRFIQRSLKLPLPY